MFISPPTPPPTIPPALTIWVHGTRPSTLFPFLGLNEEIPDDYFRSFNELPPESKTKTLLTALIKNNHQFSSNELYSFSWNGNLCVAERKLAAERLYLSIKKIVLDAKKKYGTAPPIIVISHSHGGNVVLYMEDFAHENAFTIDKTILLACPVQKETSLRIKSPFFGTIYSLHSHTDMVQIMEPQRLQPYRAAYMAFKENKSIDLLKQAYLTSIEHPLFSERHFPRTSNLIQAHIVWQTAIPEPDPLKTTSRIELFFHKMASKIKNTQRGVLHTEFVTPSFMHNLAEIITKLDNHRTLHGMVSNDDIEILI